MMISHESETRICGFRSVSNLYKYVHWGAAYNPSSLLILPASSNSLKHNSISRHIDSEVKVHSDQGSHVDQRSTSKAKCPGSPYEEV